MARQWAEIEEEEQKKRNESKNKEDSKSTKSTTKNGGGADRNLDETVDAVIDEGGNVILDNSDESDGSGSEATLDNSTDAEQEKSEQDEKMITKMLRKLALVSKTQREKESGRWRLVGQINDSVKNGDDKIIKELAKIKKGMNKLYEELKTQTERQTEKLETMKQRQEESTKALDYLSDKIMKLESVVVKMEGRRDEREPPRKKAHSGEGKMAYCYVCRGGHAAEVCNVFLDGASRRLKMEQEKRCTMCTQSATHTKCAFSSRRCQTCGGYHLNAICEIRFPQKTTASTSQVKTGGLFADNDEEDETMDQSGALHASQ